MFKFSSTYSVVVIIIIMIKCLLTKFGQTKHECVWLLFMTHGLHCAQSKYLASHLVNKYIIYFFQIFKGSDDVSGGESVYGVCFVDTSIGKFHVSKHVLHQLINHAVSRSYV